jgi:molybdenum cofactor cytidylyltransferase
LVGILLAAGDGTRFGGDKCLAPMPDGVPMILHAAAALRPAVDRLVCVVRSHDQALKTLLRDHGLAWVEVTQPRLGMSASLHCGIRHSADDAGGWLLALADMPLISPETCREVAAALRRGGAIVVPTWRGRRGHPVGFARGLRDELLAIAGDRGARAVIERHCDRVSALAVPDPGILRDIDTKEELAQCWQAARRG